MRYGPHCSSSCQKMSRLKVFGPDAFSCGTGKSTTGPWLKSVIAKSDEERLTTSSSNDSGTVVKKLKREHTSRTTPAPSAAPLRWSSPHSTHEQCLLGILSKRSMSRVKLADLQREMDKAPILTWKHMAFNICQESESNDLPGRAHW